jgi:hypothetical protein
VALMRAQRRRGGTVIYEVDDLLTDMAPHLLHARAMQDRAGWVRACMATAHLVTASTELLAEALALETATPISVVPNHAQACSAPLPQATPGAPAHVLLAASDRVQGDAMLRALRALQQEDQVTLQIVAVGPVAEACDAAGLRVQRKALMPRDAFLAMARALPNVVAAIPLDASRFSACKSAVKWYDFAEAGIPTLASAVSPYREAIADGLTGTLVADTQAAWHAALQHALVDADWRERTAQAARRQVRQAHTLAHSAAAWGSAIDRALELSAQSESRPVGFSARVREGFIDQRDALLDAMRLANRSRLARRNRNGR